MKFYALAAMAGMASTREVYPSPYLMMVNDTATNTTETTNETANSTGNGTNTTGGATTDADGNSMPLIIGGVVGVAIAGGLIYKYKFAG